MKKFIIVELLLVCLLSISVECQKPPSCPPHSRLQTSCSPTCEPTCQQTQDTSNCNRPNCPKACVCRRGYVMNYVTERCVRPQDCPRPR